ncbi:hypothetical protein BJV78DRAFT_1079420, partial [Lactifluus subvellereus]
YYDDVLSAKVKSVVSSMVKRSKLEKSKLTISYKAFVEDLDPGDSFTTMLTELLIREMAEHHQCQAAADCQLISNHMANGLCTLALSQRVYHHPGVCSLNAYHSYNLTDHLTMPPEELQLNDSNSLESMVNSDTSGAMEGARMNSDLY